MAARIKHEVSGNLREHPLAELLFEASNAELTGSFRLSKDKQKIVVYVHEGEVVYAVSNSRLHRLYEFLLRENKIYKAQLADIENFVNDTELGKALIEKLFITRPELTEFLTKQVEGIVRCALNFEEGSWTFDPLKRIKEGINFQIDVNQMLFDYARNLSAEDIFVRFEVEEETFSLNPMPPNDFTLNSQEGFLLSRFEQPSIDINELQAISGLPDKITVQILYNLWLGGFIFREKWNHAFSNEYKVDVLMAALVVKQDETKPEVEEIEDKDGELLDEEATPEPEVVEELDDETLLAQYLDRVENASNLYETLGVTPDAEPPEIKKAYFGAAKRYHPDLFHTETDSNIARRIQDCFSEIAQAYDTLKSTDARNVYDYKMRKELANTDRIKSMKSTHDSVAAEIHSERAEEDFENGYALLMDEDYQRATPFLARAVLHNRDNAKYHAYYGKVLSFDKKQSHKAEAELRKAVDIDESNATYRIILAEFYIQINLKKRAEGELNRLLERFPNDKEAKTLLDSLQEK